MPMLKVVQNLHIVLLHNVKVRQHLSCYLRLMGVCSQHRNYLFSSFFFSPDLTPLFFRFLHLLSLHCA